MLKLFVFGVVLIVLSPGTPVHAFRDVNFQRTCFAPNWITGVIEPAIEQNVGDTLGGFHAFTSRQPFGRWLIQYSIPKMSQTPLIMRKFLFYHECAHAQFNTSSEPIADCEGARAMKQDYGLSNNQVADIAAFYSQFGRVFPPPGCQL